jgi:hypothetical protein
MPYVVQIAENRLIEDDDGETGLAAYRLGRILSTILLAEEAGHAEVKTLRARGVSAFYNVLDDQGRPVGPNGPVL